MPRRFAEHDRLAYQPTAWTNRRIVIAPMLWFVDRLAIKFKYQFGMSGFQNVGGDTLVTGDATVGAHVKISQVVHAGVNTRPVWPIAARSSAERWQRRPRKPM